MTYCLFNNAMYEMTKSYVILLCKLTNGAGAPAGHLLLARMEEPQEELQSSGGWACLAMDLLYKQGLPVLRAEQRRCSWRGMG